MPPTNNHTGSALGRVLRRVGVINRDSSKGIATQLLWIGFGALVVVVLVSPWGGSPGGFGIKGNETIKIERDKNKQIVKYSIERDEGKTAWDWIGLIGVPVTLAILGIWFQCEQQKRADKESRQQRELAAEQNKEETLQRYLDRVAQLLIEKDLIALSSARTISLVESEQLSFPVVKSASAVIRARSLSVLRSFSGDGDRKGSVIRFLIETEVLLKLKVSLAGSDLSKANLNGANLEKADFNGAKFMHAHLIKANLKSAELTQAQLNKAQLFEADLSGAQLLGAQLIGADLTFARLNGANISFANLSGAVLNGANLGKADLRCSDLTKADLKDVIWDSWTQWPALDKFKGAQNVPAMLKLNLGLP